MTRYNCPTQPFWNKSAQFIALRYSSHSQKTTVCRLLSELYYDVNRNQLVSCYLKYDDIRRNTRPTFSVHIKFTIIDDLQSTHFKTPIGPKY